MVYTETGGAISIGWVLNALLLVASGALAWFARTMDKRLTTLEVNQVSKFQRLATLEAHYLDIIQRLSRMEEKLDRVQHIAR